MQDIDPLPNWVDPTRLETQMNVVSDVVDRARGRNGHPEHDVVMLQAPTGVGKTLIAEMVSRELRAKTIYSCSTKYLQDQFVRDFPYAKILKGRRNYLTTMGLVDEMNVPVSSIDDAVTAHDCTFSYASGVCSWCDDRGRCEYVRARGQARSARLAVLNSSYLLTDAHGPRQFVNRDLYVLDEADVLEDELLSHAELHLTNGRMRKLYITPPKYKTKDETWPEWIRDVALPRVQQYYETLPGLHETHNVKVIREIKYMESLLENLARVMYSMPMGKWVHDGYSERNYDSGDVIFRPVFVKQYGDRLLWNNGRKFLIMSATILSGDVMAEELGLNQGKGKSFDIIDVPSSFPVENRPVHVVPIANVTTANSDEERPKLAKAINGVLLRHQGERILVHCVSYDLAHYLCRMVSTLYPPERDRMFITYHSSREKGEALSQYQSQSNSVLFAASMERGVDLPDDLCRIQVIAKVPWPNKGDKRINARLYASGGQGWYNMHAIRTIVQMAGRAVRHREDWAVTYILDKQFVESLWKTHRLMFPRYFRDALNFGFNPRLLTHIEG